MRMVVGRMGVVGRCGRVWEGEWEKGEKRACGLRAQVDHRHTTPPQATERVGAEIHHSKRAVPLEEPAEHEGLTIERAI